MIPIFVFRNGEVTYSTSQQGSFCRFHYNKISLKDRVTRYGLLFAVERGTFDILKHEIERNKARQQSDPRNDVSATGILLDGEGQFWAVNWVRIDGKSYSRIFIGKASDAAIGWACTHSVGMDEVASVIMNERPDWDTEQIANMVTRMAPGPDVTWLPYETKTIEELSAFWRDNYTPTDETST